MQVNIWKKDEEKLLQSTLQDLTHKKQLQINEVYVLIEKKLVKKIAQKN